MVRTVTDDDLGLKILYEAPFDAQDTDPTPLVDIVAIHGIGAHPDDTWCKKVDAGRPEEHYVNWLKDEHMLPAVVPRTRIMRYGYQSQWFGGETISQKASTVAQRLLLSLKRGRKYYPLRPLIFIAHCFGGLVVLRAVVDAQRFAARWPGIFTSTTGMVFFGTPFRGAPGLNQSEILRAAQSQYEGLVQEAVVNILAPGNESSMDLIDHFLETRQGKTKAHVACFFELKPSNVGAILSRSRIQKFMVDESSGCLDQSESTDRYSLSRDHSNLVKFGSQTEEDFLTVCEVIKNMVKQSPGLVTAREHKDQHYGVKVLYDGGIKASVDIVFVPGSTSNPYETWFHEDTKTHWPSQLLPHDIPDSRILSCGYDADFVNPWNPASNNPLRNHAENMVCDLVRYRELTITESRKILFVAHSLGGLVTKYALSYSRTVVEEHLHQLERCTAGVVFLGVPHCGDDLASWAKFGTRMVSILKRANKDIVRVLRSGSEILCMEGKDFDNILRQRKAEGSEIEITCFYEELPMTGVGQIVPLHSAEIIGYRFYGIHANHMHMTKFSDREDRGYDLIIRELLRWEKLSNRRINTSTSMGTEMGYRKQLRPATAVDHSDEGLIFVDSAYGAASYGQLREVQVAPPADTEPAALEVDYSSTKYSDISTAESRTYGYKECLVDELCVIASTFKSDPQNIRSLCEVLPELLQQFALRIGQEVPSNEGLEIMVYVHRNGRRVAEAFERSCTTGHEDQEDSALSLSGTVPFKEKVMDWLTQEENIDVGMPEDAVDEVPDEPDPWTLADGGLSKVERYRELVSRTSAYSWLLANVGRELTQTTQEDDLLKRIRNEILRCLPPLPKLSTRRQPDTLSLGFQVDWNPMAFILEQEYSGDPAVALERVITLTGPPTDAQALPCFQYLNQTWPACGNCVARLLRKMMRAEISQQVQERLSDGSKLTAWSISSTVYVEVSGTRASITDVGEQLAWLGAALRSSPYDGIAYCSPYIDDGLWATKEQLGPQYGLEQDRVRTLGIKFLFQEGLHADKNSEGTCWYNLFKNPVVVQGFPIRRRTSLHKGLELPLNMMAGLVGAIRAHVFNDVVFIKGFSGMLVPSERIDDLLVWHVFFNAEGGRVSYLEPNLPQFQGVNFSHLQTSRHIVGWCGSAKSHAGGIEASYNIESSRLPSPGASCMLEKISINGGKFITAGANFNIGLKDVPVHISRKNYVQKLRWVSSKFIILWDEEDKRGWLVKGISALLHLVRASLKQYETDAFREAFLSKFDDISEPSGRSQEDYSISVLRDERNMKLPIYADKDEVQSDEENSIRRGSSRALKRTKKYYRLEDRVEELYEILEKLIDHQVNAAGQAGVKMKAHVRRRLEGWDFKDLASDRDPIYPRVAILHTLGKGWVDFIRSIQAVTLLGRGFGQIISSSRNVACLNWTEVPKGKFYLTACVSDLQQIMEMDGDYTSNPMRICNGVSWFSPSAPFETCRCTKTRGGGHSDFIQTLWPTSLVKLLPKREKVPLREKGAVIFGHNSRFNWKWEDMGKPIEGNPSLESTETEEEFYDSGIGLTENSDSGRLTRGLPEYGRHSHIEAPEPAPAGHVNLQDTAGSNTVDTVEPALKPSKRFAPLDRMNRYFRLIRG